MAGHGAAETAPGLAISSNLVLVVSGDGTICDVLNAPDNLFNAEPPAGNRDSIDDLWSKAMADIVRGQLKRTLRSRQVVCDEIENPADRQVYDFTFVAQGRDRVLMIVRDVSQQRVDLTRIQQLAYNDEVTNLPNREFLYVELQKITEMQRLREGRAAVICFYVHHFDDHGLALLAGEEDDVLTELAARLTEQLRGYNNPAETDYDRFSIVARTDFRQFAVVLPSISAGEDAEAVVVRLLEALKEPVSVSNRTLMVGVSAGIALFPQDGNDAETLFKSSVTAVEEAKSSNATPYRFHSGTVRMRLLQRQDVAVELQTALERGDFQLNFLPILDTRSRSVPSIEALLRWPETILGSQPTRKIVTIAENTGLIVPIGEWVLREACEQLLAWREAGNDKLRVAVNLSAQEFSRLDLLKRMEAIIHAAGADPSNVELEIKEHLVFRDAMKNYVTLRELKSIGFRIVVDDYGTGACSLAHLSQSPVDAIKIDNSFVTDLETQQSSQAACRAVIALARELDVEVIAEGVETEGQAKFLVEQGCNLLQGFLFSEPLTGDAVIDHLEAITAAESDRAVTA